MGIGTILNGLKGGVDEAIDNVAGSNFVKNVKTTVSELNENMAALANQNRLKKMPIIGRNMTDMAWSGEGKEAAINKALKDLYEDVDEKTAKKIQKVVAKNRGNWGTADEYAEGIRKYLGEGTYNDFSTRMHDISSSTLSSENISSQIGGLNYVRNVPRAYFNPVDEAGNLLNDVRSSRIKGAIGAYAGVTLGGRFISGGSLTKDKYGQNDIAGIPFV